MSGLLCLKWNNHSSSFLKKLSVIYTKEIYCDVTIACQNKFYPVHRLVLSTCSEYFEEIFERVQCRHPFIIVKDITPPELEALLSYMYNGEVHVLQETLPGLVRAAETLKIKGLAVPEAPFSTEHGALNKLKEKLDAAFPSTQRKRIRRESGESNKTNTNSQEIWPLSEASFNKLEKSVSGFRSEFGNESSTTEKEDNSEMNDIKVETVEERVDVNYDVPNLESFTPVDSSAVNAPGLKLPQEDLLPHPEVDHTLNSEVNNAQCSSWDGIAKMNSNVGVAQGEMCDAKLYLLARRRAETISQALSQKKGPSRDSDDIPAELTAASALESIGEAYLETANAVYECSQCNYKAPSRRAWRQHSFEKHPRNHSFACKLCNYETSIKSSFNRHMLIHSGEKKFKCNLCPYKTAYNFNLKTHSLRHKRVRDSKS